MTQKKKFKVTKANAPTSAFTRTHFKARDFMRRLHTINALLAMIGICFGMIISEYTWHLKCISEPLYIDGCETADYLQANEYLFIINGLKWATLAFTLLLLCMLCFTYYHIYIWRKNQNEYFTEETFMSSGMWKSLLKECLVCCIQPIPEVSINWVVQSLGQDIMYPLDCGLSVLMFMRLYLLLKLLAYVSGLHSSLSIWISRRVAVDINPLFILKSQIALKPIQMTSVILFSSAFLSAYCIRSCERPLNSEFSYYWNSLWLSFVTMTTVGYGDLYPETHCGRFFSMVSCFIAMVVLGIWVYAVHTKLKFSVNEQKYMDLLEEALNRNHMETMAARLVQTWWKAHRNKHIHTSNNSLSKFQAQKKCMYILRQWRSLRRVNAITSMNSEYTMVELFHKQNEMLTHRLKKIENKLKTER